MPQNQFELIAKIFIRTQEVKISTLQLWLNIKRKDGEQILAKLQALKIISTYKNGTYEILVTETELEEIIRKLNYNLSFLA